MENTMFSLRTFAAATVIALAGTGAWAQDLAFQLINNSGMTLWEFYASPNTASSWEEDILGTSTLPSGSSVTVTIADGRTNCIYDMRMVFENGSVLEDQVNMCNMGSYTIN